MQHKIMKTERVITVGITLRVMVAVGVANPITRSVMSTIIKRVHDSVLHDFVKYLCVASE
jgi:hypothetical protein